MKTHVGTSFFCVLVFALVAACKHEPAQLPGGEGRAELSLNQVSPGSSDRAIVFVHGLDGSPEGTFTAANALSWPRLIATDTDPFVGADPPPPLSAFSVYTLDYRQVYRSRGNIAEGAKTIADYLINQGLFERHNHIWFVTHSLGGLMVKRALLIYDRENYDRLLRRIAGVFFIGVPANGAPLADIASDSRVKVLLELFGKNFQMINDLRPESAGAFLGSLEDDWQDFLRGRRVLGENAPPFTHCAYELNPTVANIRVVEKIFAQPCADSNSIPMADSHTSMVKPTTVKSPNYLWVKTGIGADAYKLRNWGSVSRSPEGETLGEIIKDFQTLHRQPPDQSGVLQVSETIQYLDPKSEGVAASLLLSNRTYVGPNVAGFLREVSVQNSCVTVQANASLRDLKVGVTGPTKVCRSGPDVRLICEGLACPR